MRRLFPELDAMPNVAPTAEPTAPGLYADVVFDRPLDSAYTYAVPAHLQSTLAVGMRVEVPFGRGDRGTPGFCVRLSDQAPSRQTKSISKVLDDAALVDDHLMRLTRWMADYYLCGWGQVLHAVVPAGVREKAGTREATFVEAVPRESLPDPVPTVTPKQKQALENVADGIRTGRTRGVCQSHWCWHWCRRGVDYKRSCPQILRTDRSRAKLLSP